MGSGIRQAPHIKRNKNGKAERIDRTLIKMTRALLMEKDLPKELWAAAIQAAAHIHNPTPAARQEMTPHQMFNGKPADTSLAYSLFGCLAYSLTPTARRKKLDARSEPGLFIGYAEGSKPRCILRWYKGKAAVVETANVRFVEDSQPYFEQLKGGYGGNSSVDDGFIKLKATDGRAGNGAEGANATEGDDNEHAKDSGDA
jgi:hypothetical protein